MLILPRKRTRRSHRNLSFSLKRYLFEAGELYFPLVRGRLTWRLSVFDCYWSISLLSTFTLEKVITLPHPRPSSAFRIQKSFIRAHSFSNQFPIVFGPHIGTITVWGTVLFLLLFTVPVWQAKEHFENFKAVIALRKHNLQQRKFHWNLEIAHNLLCEA